MKRNNGPAWTGIYTHAALFVKIYLPAYAFARSRHILIA